MKFSKFLKLLLFVLFVSVVSAQEHKTYFDGEDLPLEYGKIKCLVVCVGGGDNLAKISDVIGDGLIFTDQFDVQLNKAQKIYSKRELLSLFKKDISYCIFLKELRSKRKEEIKIKVTLKDTSTNKTEFEKTFSGNKDHSVTTGNIICSKLSKDLTGKEGIFLNKLAFCEQLSSWHKIIYVSDYSCKFRKVVASKNKVNSVPCWHTTSPILFYTRLSKKRSELMALYLKNNRHEVVCACKGSNSQPSVSEDGKRVALCLGRTGNSEIYLYNQEESEKRKRRVFRQLTKNGGNNVNPCYLSNNDIVFCSDFETCVPHIYYFNMKNRSLHRLTKGGYSAGAAYCKQNNSIVFTKIVDHVFQLFTLKLDDMESGCKEEQLTFGNGDKHDPNWSECGDYIYFSYRCPDDKGKRIHQVAVFNVASKNTRVLTFGEKQKSFPVLNRRKIV